MNEGGMLERTVGRGRWFLQNGMRSEMISEALSSGTFVQSYRGRVSFGLWWEVLGRFWFYALKRWHAASQEPFPLVGRDAVEDLKGQTEKEMSQIAVE